MLTDTNITTLNRRLESTDLSHADFDTSHPVIRYFESLLSKSIRKKGKSSFLVFKHGKYVTIQTKDIAFFHINNDIPTIMSFDNKIYSISLSLDEVNRLISSTKFFRINRQYLVNFAAIKEVEHYYSRKLLVRLKFDTEEDLIVCKDKASLFLSWLENR